MIDIKHPSGHSMNLYESLKRVKDSLDKQGEIGRRTIEWMKAEKQ